MKKTFIGALAALFSFVGAASAYELPKPSLSLRLYPDGQNADKGIALGPGESNGITGPSENRNGSLARINDDARIDIYLPEKCNGQMIVVCPGGGYTHISSVNEGSRVADWCLKNGIAACVVIYRLPNGHSEVPLTDVQNAFRYCRAHGAEWGVKQIGVMGFSAGGHLAASASTLFTDDVTRPDFSVLVYPVITFEEFTTHSGTRAALLGDRTRDRRMVEHYSLENRVSVNTPPAILLLSGDDRAVPPENSIRYYRAIQKYGVRGEMHIYTYGGHGWGFTTVENSGADMLGDQREDFFRTLGRWLAARRAEIR